MTTLYAHAYSGGHGFSFRNLEEWKKKYKAALKMGIEEFEIDFHDGSDEDVQLFKAMKVGQSDIEDYYRVIGAYDTPQKAALYQALSQGFSLKQAEEKAEGGAFKGSDTEYVEQMFEDMGEIPQALLLQYFDYEACARDMGFNGELDEFEFAGDTWVVDPRG